MDKIEETIINLLGYHTVLVNLNNYTYWQVLDKDNNIVGYVNYDKSSNTNHIQINTPTRYLESSRKKDSNEIEIQYKIRDKNTVKNKGKNKVYIKI